MRTFGTAGANADRLARRRAFARTAIGFVAIGGVVAAALTGRTAAVFPIAVVAFMIRHRLARGIRMAEVGAAAEISVAARLSRLRASVVLFDIDLRGRRSDIDIVIVGPGVATVEVKRARGRIKAMSDGTLRVGGQWLPGRPLAQAASHAVAVSRFTDRHVEAILCITGMTQRPRIIEYKGTEVRVTSEAGLLKIVRKLPRVLGSVEAREIAHRLRTGNSASQMGIRSVT